MDIRPILSTLRRHKTAAALIVLEIALSCAIICNAVFLIGERIERMDRPSGLAEDEVVRVQMGGIGRDANARSLTIADLAVLRAIPGVKAATVANQVPYGNSSWNSSVNLEADQQNPTLNASVYLGEEQLLEAMGLQLIAGRDFNPDEYIDYPTPEEQADATPPSVIILSRETGARSPSGWSASWIP
jgi:putative ABC transport system permease protein